MKLSSNLYHWRKTEAVPTYRRHLDCFFIQGVWLRIIPVIPMAFQQRNNQPLWWRSRSNSKNKILDVNPITFQCGFLCYSETAAVQRPNDEVSAGRDSHALTFAESLRVGTVQTSTPAAIFVDHPKTGRTGYSDYWTGFGASYTGDDSFNRYDDVLR